MIDRFEHFVCSTNEINKYWHKLAGEEMKKYGLKAPHAIYFILLLTNNESGLTATRLCERSGRDKADASRMLTLMEKNGLVYKEGVHQNFYNGVYKLTEDGTKIANAIKEKAIRTVEIAGKDLTDESRKNFYDALDSIASNLKNLTKKGIPD